jgi:uncharacterized protein (TIGR02996 family)
MDRSGEDALIERIQANRDSDQPRLAYAGWLERRGDPRGTYIRLEVELGRMTAGNPRYLEMSARRNELYEAHQEEWAQPFRDLGLSMTFYGRTILFCERGMVETLWVDAEGVFPERAAELFLLAPALREVCFQGDAPVNVAGLACCPWLARLENLDLSAKGITPADVRTLLGSPHLTGLRQLDLGYNELGVDGARALAQGQPLPRLEQLVLRSSGFDDSAVHELANMRLARLRHLDLSGNRFGPEGLPALLRSSLLARLRVLRLGDCDLGPEGVEQLAEVNLPELKELYLDSNELGPDGALALARCSWAQQLEVLDLRSNQVEDEGVQALTASPYLTGLVKLDLGSADVGPESARALANWPGLGQLEALHLWSNWWGDEGVSLLAGAPQANRLRILELYDNRIGPAGVRALAASSHLTSLEELDLRENPLEEEGADRLASGSWPALTTLRVSALTVGEQGEAVLAERFGETVQLN